MSATLGLDHPSDHDLDDPFDVSDETAYLEWRGRKLAHYPAGVEHIRVAVKDLACPTGSELEAVGSRVAAFNMALIQASPESLSPEAVLAFGRATGLRRTDAHLFASEQAVSYIQPVTPGAGGEARQSDYIPYTTRPLSWHTDGYYNAPNAQVEAWTLFCVRSAAEGGVNDLLDPEIAYLLLRDESPHHIRALSHPQALTIPANVQDGQILRPESTGPVFSIRKGHLHMRYSARATNVIWRNTPETQAARKALDQLFSSARAFTFHHKLEPGEGILSNNVLHNRSGFRDHSADGSKRLLYRARYRDRIQLGAPARNAAR